MYPQRLSPATRLSRNASGTLSRAIALIVVASLLATLVPGFALAARDDQTIAVWSDADNDGNPELWGIDWDGDGLVDEWWHDDNDDGVIDRVETDNTGGDATRSPRGKPGMGVKKTPLPGGGIQIGVDWEGDGRYNETWWDSDGNGIIDDTDIHKTESKVVDNTKATRFRGVFVGVKNGLDYPEKDVGDLTGALAGYPASWNPADMNSLTGAAATPAAIQGAIDAAKAGSKPGDEFVFYFSGHGGGWNKKKGKMGGGRIDTDGDETGNRVPESEFGRFDGSEAPTAPPGQIMIFEYDLDGNGTAETAVGKDEFGQVKVWRDFGAGWQEVGADTNGDGAVDAADGGIDMNGDGDKNDSVGIDDTILVAGGQQITDDQLKQWLSGFPESVTIVVILDACHSGSFVNDLQNVTDNKGQKLKPGHLEVVAAAAWDETAIEKPISNGVLTQSILNALTQLPGSVTGGHTTSIADFIGDKDDRTTTAELFTWAGPQAVTYCAADDDSDGVRNEDGVDCGIVSPVEVAFSATSVGSPATGSGVEPIPWHEPADDDGDLEFDEDPETPPDSFFDVYYAPDFGDLPTPRLLTCFSGDQPFDASGFAPDVRVWSESGIETGTPTEPGPTFELSIRKVPDPLRPPPIEETLGLMEYASDWYDISLFEVEQWPPLEGLATTVTPGVSKTDVGAKPRPTVKIAIKAKIGIPPGEAIPVMYNPGELTVKKAVEWEANEKDGTIEFWVSHLSQFGLLYVGPPVGVDTMPPYMGDTHITARSDGPTVTVAWSNTTAEDWAITRVLESQSGHAVSATETADQYVCYEGIDVSTETARPVGTYYYSMFASDWAGNWSSDPVTCTVTVSTALDPCAIEGTIFNGNPTELPDARVNLYRSDGSAYMYMGSLTSGEGGVGGDYAFTGLDPGTYRVGADDPAGVYVREFFGESPLLSGSPDIVLEEGQGVSGVDIDMEGIGGMSGTVTSGAAPVAGLTVKAYRFNGVTWVWRADATTNADGDFLFPALREGSYKVSFYDPAGMYVREWWDDSVYAAGASTVDVNPGVVTSGIDADVVGVTRMQGTITESGNPTKTLGGINVILYAKNGLGLWFQKRVVVSAADGTWSTTGLPPGAYRLSYYDPTGAYVRYTPTGEIDLAYGTPYVSWVELKPIPQMSGTVTAEDTADPIAGAKVLIYGYDSLGRLYQRRVVYTAADGSWCSGELTAGALYRLSFIDPTGDHVREYYDDVASLAAAQDLGLAPGAQFTGLDAALAPAATIGGTVTDAGSGLPVADIQAKLYRHNGITWVWIGDAITAADGTYLANGLAAGTYRVSFYDPSGLYTREYWNDAPTLSTATSLVLGAGDDATGIDAQLAGP